MKKHPYLITSLIWGLLVIVFFYPVFFQTKVIAPLDILEFLLRPWSEEGGGIGIHNASTYDAISQYIPYDWSIYQSLKTNGFIGWNPYIYGGYPILENTMQCPGDWHHLLYRFLSFWDGWNLGIILQFFIAGLGIILMLKEENKSPVLALLGAIGFAFYSQHINWIHHRWILGTTCWFPWIIWAITKARKNNKLIDPLSIAFTALAFRGGHLQSCLFVVLLVGCLFVVDITKTFDKTKIINSCKRNFLFYGALGLFAFIFMIDVAYNTIPPYIEAQAARKYIGFFDSIIKLPDLIALVFPTVLGTSQSLDIAKLWGSGILNEKFIGTPIFILSTLGLFDKRTSAKAKLLYCVGLFVCFTPLSTWLYHRVTPVFAIGSIWLAVEKFEIYSKEGFPQKYKKVFIILLLSIIFIWAIASVVISIFEPNILSFLQNNMTKLLPVDKPSRLAWMHERCAYFISEIKIWHPQKIALLSLLTLGTIAITKINQANQRQNTLISFAITIVSFIELFIYSSTWITYSDRPIDDTPYKTPNWVLKLKQETENKGYIYCHNYSKDFDYLQLNTPTVYGIKFFQGYETITPTHLEYNISNKKYSLDAAADCGISHIIVEPNDTDLQPLDDWNLCIDSKEFKLYENPKFYGLKRLEKDQIFVLQPYHKDWKAYYNEIQLPTYLGANNEFIIDCSSIPKEALDSSLDLIATKFEPHNLKFLPLQILGAFIAIILCIIQNRKYENFNCNSEL